MLARIFLVWRTLMGHYRRHPAQGIFLLLGLSLGVALLLGILIVSEAAKASFASAERTAGAKVVANIYPARGQQALPESVYVSLRKSGFTQVLPRVEGRIALADGRFVTLEGIDAFALMQGGSSNPADNHQSQSGNTPMSILAFSYPPYQTLVAESYAQMLGLKAGDELALDDGAKLPPLVLVNDNFGIGYSLMCDLRCAQSVLGLQGQLNSISIVREIDDQAALEALLPDSVRLSFPGRNAHTGALADAFFLNITAVSFLAFLVGCFIAFNAVRFSVLQRQPLVKQLRLVGTQVKEITLALSLELLSWALLASIVGCALGWLLASALLPAAGLTLVQLFQGNQLLNGGSIGQWWGLALTIALLATFIATAGPFWQLARQKPLQQNTVSSTRQTTLPGLGLLILGVLLTQMPQGQSLGFAVTACWFFGAALLVPPLLSQLYTWLSRLPGLERRPGLHWAVHDGKFNQARLSVALMAFTVAIAAGISVTTMVHSFRLALEDYLDQVLAEDIYLQPHNSKTLPIKAFLDEHPDVHLAYRFLHTTGTMEHNDKSISAFVRGITDHSIRHDSLALERQQEQPWQKLHRREGVMINQTLAMGLALSPGDQVTMGPKHNCITTEILGVYYSYGATFPAIAIDQQWLKTLWPGVDTAEVGVFLKPGTDADDMAEQLKQQFALKNHHVIKPKQFKAIALNIFEQTFAVTQILTLFTLLIAAIGIYCACYSAQLENTRQQSLLKILGLSHRQVAGLSLIQLGFNATVAALVAIPLGVMVAWASVHIVLQYSFGWHFAIQPQPATLALIASGAVLVALLAALFPLYRLGRQTNIEAFGGSQ